MSYHNIVFAKEETKTKQRIFADDFITGIVLGLVSQGTRSISIRTNDFDRILGEVFLSFEEQYSNVFHCVLE